MTATATVVVDFAAFKSRAIETGHWLVIAAAGSYRTDRSSADSDNTVDRGIGTGPRRFPLRREIPGRICRSLASLNRRFAEKILNRNTSVSRFTMSFVCWEYPGRLRNWGLIVDRCGARVKELSLLRQRGFRYAFVLRRL